MKPLKQLTTSKLSWVLRSPQSLALPNTFVAWIKCLFIARRSSHHIAVTHLHRRSMLSKRMTAFTRYFLCLPFKMHPAIRASCTQRWMELGELFVVTTMPSAVSLREMGAAIRTPLLPCWCSSWLPSLLLSQGLSTGWCAESLIRTAWPYTRSGCSLDAWRWDAGWLKEMLLMNPSCFTPWTG